MIRDSSQCAPDGTPRRPVRAVLSSLGALVVTVVAVTAVNITTAAAAGQSITAPTTGPAGGVVAIGGSGWSAFDHVNAYLQQGTTSTYFCGLSADSAGTLSPATCSLPDLPAGAYTVTSSDGTLTADGPTNGFTLTPSVTLANTTGSVITNTAVGDTVDLAGNGFTASSTITKVTVGTTVVTTTPAAPATSASGTFTGASFVVPAVTKAGPSTVTVTDAASHSGTAVLTVYKPTLTVPASAAPGSVFSISGAGWPVGDHLFLYLSQGSTSSYIGCSTYSDSTGALDPQSCTVPAGFTQGAYTLVLSDGAVSAAKPFTLNPGIVLTNSSGTAVVTSAVGDTVDLAGNGFTASSTITKVTVGTTVVTTTPAAPATSASGTFTGASFVVPAVTKAGPSTVTVTDAASHSGTAVLTVYKPTLTVPASAAPGSVFSISGAGWPVGDHLFLYLSQGSTSSYIGCSTYSDSTGALDPQSCTVPAGFTQGAYALVLSDGAVSAAKPFTLNPGIVLTNSSGTAVVTSAVGDTVDLAGNGFTGLSTITKVTVGTTVVTTTPTTPTLSSTGSFTGASFVVPALTPGSYTVTVTDAAGKKGTAVLTVYKPTLTVPASAAPGSVFSISGAGWPVGDHLFLYLSQGSTSSYIGCSTYSDSTGALDPQSCTVPAGFTQGAYALVLSDGAVSAAKPFTLNPGIVLTNSSGTAVVTSAVGDTVDLAGNGFTGLSTITKVTVGTTVVTTTPTTPTLSSTGSFTGASFVVPALTPGSYTVTVTDAAGKKGTAVLTVYKPTLSAPAAGVSGTQFVYSGAGWPVGDHLFLYLSQGTTSAYIGCSTYSDSSGAVGPETCTVPTGFSQGAYTLVLSDGAVSVSSAFTLNPAISITNTSGQPIASAAPGTTVDLSGSGFTGLSTITKLAFGTTTVPITPASPATSATGSFSGESFTVPSITHATYTVTGTDAAGKHGSVTFTIT